jgi:putative Ca2+/H+ antiporter (TMEM165/GDT1 family)
VEAFLISASSLLFAEFGDKTQLMALVLAVRFRRPIVVMTAILIATVLLNSLAVAVGAVLGDLMGPDMLRWALGLSFLGAAWWAFAAADEQDGDVAPKSHYGAFVTTFVAFCLAELGDKTQFTAAALAMKFNWAAVVAGSTVGMTFAILPAVVCGEQVCKLVPIKYVRWTTGALFVAVGVATLAGWL